MRTTTRTRYLATLGLGLVLLVAAPARADDAPADIVALLERARAAERVEKDLAKAQALYEQVFAKAASTDAGREAGIRLLDLDAGRTHEAWLALIGTLSDAHGVKLDKDVVDKLVELAQRHVQPGETVKTPRGVFMGATTALPATRAVSPADAALATGFTELGAITWFASGPPPDGSQGDLDRLLRALGSEARPSVERWLARGEHVAFGIALMLRLDPAAGWTWLGRMLQSQPASIRIRLAGQLHNFYAWAPVEFGELESALRPVVEAPNASAVHEAVYKLFVNRASVEALPGFVASTPHPAWREYAWRRLAIRSQDDEEALLALAQNVRSLPVGLDDVPSLLFALRPSSAGRVPAQNVDQMARVVVARAEVALAILEAPVLADVAQQGGMGRGSWAAIGGEIGVVRALLQYASRVSKPELVARLASIYGAMLLHGSSRVRELMAGVGDELPIDFLAVEPPAQPRDVLQVLESAGPMHGSAPPLHRSLRRAALNVHGVWEALLEVLASGDRASAARLRWVMDATPRPQVPEGAEDACLGMVVRVAAEGGRLPPAYCLELASLADPDRYDSAVLAALRAERVEQTQEWIAPVLEAPPVRLARWIDELAAIPSGFSVDILEELLARELMAAGPKALLARAADRAQPASTQALYVLARRGLMLDELVHLVADEVPLVGTPAADVRVGPWLYIADRTLDPRLVPLLLSVYEHAAVAGVGERAAKALDSIRERQERLRYFQTMLDGPDDPEGEILPLLDDEDAAVRQGAIQALGAVGGPRALVQLLKLAKRDGAPAAERAAALEAVAKISARAPAGATSTQARSPAAAEAGSSGGK